jgi:ribose/xylose/arabinose/galactoside ABC-type transport system permease subunit
MSRVEVGTPPAARGDGGRGPLGRLLRSNELGLVVAIAAALGLIAALDPSRAFFGAYSLRTLAHNAALFGVLAVGAAVVIIAGGIDLSVGSVVALAGVVAARLATQWLPGAHATGAPLPVATVAAAVALVLLLGAAIGGLHAFMITLLRLPPFIATLATMAGLRGVANLVSHNRPITLASPTFRVLGSENAWTVPIFAGVALGASLMMGATVLGRHLYALGGNEAAARLSGLRTGRLKLVAYAISGMLAALAGVLFTGNTGQADYRMGVTYELYAITAAAVGGCSLAGGVGSIRGTVLGLVLIQVVIKGTGLVVRGIDPSQIEGIVLGAVVVLAVALNARVRGRE